MPVSLRSLSDADICSRVRDLAARERKLTLLLLLHLNEIERRKLHLKQGYSSMFDYCTSGLRYSEPAAVRRIRTARCVARFPEVYSLLEANEVNLSTVARVSRVLTTSNKNALLASIRRRSQREVDAIVAEYQPRTVPRDFVRPVVVRVAAAESGGAAALAGSDASVTSGLFAPAGSAATSDVARVNATANNDATTRDDKANDACEKGAYRRSDGVFDPTDCAPPSETFVTEKRVQFQFTAAEGFQKKLEKIKSLAWHRLPTNPSLEQVFELALDSFIERHDPSARRERRQQRAGGHVRASASCTETAPPKAHSGLRYVPAAVKEEVFSRDDGRCTFVGSNGKRCASKTALQVDHIKPVARGGASSVDNLRLLCAYHNRLESERLMGPWGRWNNATSPPRLRE
jgi:5-methylcytosine-specific restriction endonuclease McrA